jgi:hypothetical protein
VVLTSMCQESKPTVSWFAATAENQAAQHSDQRKYQTRTNMPENQKPESQFSEEGNGDSDKDGERNLSGVGSGQSTQVRPWPSWILRYKDFIQSLGVLVATAALICLFLQVCNSVKQTRAIWLENMPYLNFNAINPTNDIRPAVGTLYTSSGGIPADSSKHFAVTLALKNEGRSAAQFDTIYYQLVSGSQILNKPVSHPMYTLARERAMTEKCPLNLIKGSVNVLRVKVPYYWEQRSLSDERMMLDRCYVFQFVSDGSVSRWTAYLTTIAQFDSAAVGKELVTAIR